MTGFLLERRQPSKKRLEYGWLTPYLTKLIDLNSKYFKEMKANIVNENENKNFRNKVSSELKKSKNVYYKNLFKVNANNTKKTIT